MDGISSRASRLLRTLRTRIRRAHRWYCVRAAWRARLPRTAPRRHGYAHILRRARIARRKSLSSI